MFKHEEINYNPLQKETEKYINDDCNLVVLAPTSSGKTLVAEQYIEPVLLSGRKAIYLSPLKALTNEKLNDWSDKVESIVAVTGDHMTTPVPIRADLVLMTTEALDSKTRGMKEWLSKVDVIVSDESHLLASPGRGDAFEVGLTRFGLLNPNARIVFLSATIPNTGDLAEWLTRLNGKTTKIVSTEWRPVEQEYHLVKMPNRPWDFNESAINEIVRIKKKNRDKQFLIFVHTVNLGHTISKRIKCPFHYSKVPMDERHKIEEGFRNKQIRTLVSTSTLAYGLNLPADVGIIVGARRGPMEVDSADLKQEAGRIGRYGLSKKGEVYFLFQEEIADEKFQEVKETPDIISVLPDRLYFHITSFIAREEMQEEAIDGFLGKTLAFSQHTLRPKEALDILLQYDVIKKQENRYLPTNLGKASALMYLDPIDLYFLKQNFQQKPLTPTGIALSYSMTPSNQMYTYLPKDLKNPIETSYPQQTLIATCLRDWMNGQPLAGIHAVIVPPIIKDIDRIASALKIAGLQKAYIDNISLMIKNGVHSEMLDLISIKGIGRKRALALYAKGIKTPQAILDSPKLSENILGKATFNSVKMVIGQPGKYKLLY